MKLKKSLFILATMLILGILSIKLTHAQLVDWRNAKHGDLIYTYGYCDQPYVVVLENGKWLTVFTTNAGHEGITHLDGETVLWHPDRILFFAGQDYHR